MEIASLGNAFEQNAEVEDQDDAAALASAMDGYNARGNNAPPASQSADTDAVSEELRALKERVAAMKDSSADAVTVRKMHGEIGNINRTLQQLQQAAQPQQNKPAQQAPANDELAAAIASAELVAEEYPEMAGPLVKAMKALNARSPGSAASIDPDAINNLVASRLSSERVEIHMDLLGGLIPDWKDVVGLPDDKGAIPETDFRKWLATQPSEYQEKMLSSNNAFEIKAGIDEFRAATKSKQAKQNRLASNVVSRNTAQPVASVIPDEEGFNIGYYKGQKPRR